MQQQSALTVGHRLPMIKAFVVALIGSLCYHVATDSLPDMRPPKIESLRKYPFIPRPGKPLNMSCVADPGYPDGFSLIYWLVNNTFVEMLDPLGRITESEETERTANNGVVVRRNLMLTVVKHADLSVSYTCVVMSPMGVDSKTIDLTQRKKNLRKKSTTNAQRRSGRLPALAVGW